MANIALLEKVLEHIEADREHWNQRRWCTPTVKQSRELHESAFRWRPCRTELPIDVDTSFCFAGWAVQLCAEPAAWADAQELYVNSRDDQRTASWTPEGPVIPVAERARRILGLTYGQASYLFDSGRDLAGIQRFVHLLKIENRMWEPRTNASRLSDQPRASVSRLRGQPRATVWRLSGQHEASGEEIRASAGEPSRELVDA